MRDVYILYWVSRYKLLQQILFSKPSGIRLFCKCTTCRTPYSSLGEHSPGGGDCSPARSARWLTFNFQLSNCNLWKLTQCNLTNKFGYIYTSLRVPNDRSKCYMQDWTVLFRGPINSAGQCESNYRTMKRFVPFAMIPFCYDSNNTVC
jgi:hypothetical protein